MTAQVTPTLSVEGGCVGFDQPDAGLFTVVVWPSATTWSASDGDVVVSDGTRFKVGEPVQLVGGFLSVDDLSGIASFGSGLHDAVATCSDVSGGAFLAGGASH